MDKAHEVEHVAFEGTTLVLHVDGRQHRVDITKQSQRLAAATPEQRARFTVSPTGYGIHWAEIDEDLSIDGLLKAAPRRSPSKATAVKKSSTKKATTTLVPAGR